MKKLFTILFATLIPFLSLAIWLSPLNQAEARVAPPAGTIFVNTLVDENDGSCSNGDCSLRDAIQIADPGNTITFTVDGTINISTLGHLVITKDLNIQAGGRITVAAGLSNRIFNIEGGNITLDGLTLHEGAPAGNDCGLFNTQCGGGIMLQNNSAVLTLTNSVLDDFIAVQGGGIYNNGSRVIIQDTTISNGRTSSSGGAIYNRGGTVELSNVRLVENQSSSSTGGAIFNTNSSTLTIEDSWFSENFASSSAAALLNNNSSVATIRRTTFDNNEASYGTIQNSATMTIEDSTLSDNLGSIEAGGIINSSGNLTVVNTTFSENKTPGEGGAVINYATATFTNSTITLNEASSGGGITTESSNFATTRLNNTIVAGNVISGSRTADDLAIRGTGLIDSFQSGGSNLIGEMEAGINAFNVTGDQTGVLNPMLGSLQDNGGPTETHALLVGSPAFNAGNNANCPGADQRGVLRPRGSICDIGRV